MGIFSASYSGQLLPTVTSWRVTDIVRNTPSVPEAMERLSAQECIPPAWAHGHVGSADAPRFFYDAFDDVLENRVPLSMPSPELLELLASHPHRVEEAERLVLGGLKAFGGDHKIAWVAVDGRDRGTGIPETGSLNALGVSGVKVVETRESGRTERFLVLGMPKADEKAQKKYERALVTGLFDPTVPIGFGNVHRFNEEEAVRILFAKHRPSVIGALETYIDCLKEVIRTQGVLAKEFRDTQSHDETDDYPRWLKDHDQSQRADRYLWKHDNFGHWFCGTLGISEPGLWVPAHLGVDGNEQLSLLNFKPRYGKSPLEAVEEFIGTIRPKLDGAFWYGLDLGNAGLDAKTIDQIAAKLAKSGALHSINDLNLSGLDSLSDEAILPLLRDSGTEALRHLNLAGTFVGNETAAAIAGSPHLEGLETLDLSGTDINDDGIVALFRSRILRKLHFLDIAGAYFTPEGAEEVMKTKGLPSLAGVHYSPDDWDPEMAKRFEDWLEKRGVSPRDILRV